MPRILVAYYSRSGRTRTLARAIAKALRADVEEIRDPTDRAGIVGYLRSGLEAWAGVLAPIEHPRRDPARYDAVVIATPVWTAAPSTPARTYLWHARGRLPAVAFALTLGGSGDARAFERMRELAGRKPVATIAVREETLGRGVPRAEIARFADRVRARAHPGRPGSRGRAGRPTLVALS